MDIFAVLSFKGTAKILAALRQKERMRYGELVVVVGLATTTTRTLKAMEEAKLVEKEAPSEPYKPVAYWLTEKGRRMSDLVASLQGLE